MLAREAVAFAGSVRAAVSELEHEVDSKVVGAAIIPHGDFAYDPSLVHNANGSAWTLLGT